MPTARIATFAAAALGTALAAACTTAPERHQAALSSEGQRCFLPNMVNSFHAADDNKVHVFVGANDVYELEIMGACPNVDWSQQIGIRSTLGGTWVCQGYDAELLVPGVAGGVDECPVSMVRQLSEAEAMALRGHQH